MVPTFPPDSLFWFGFLVGVWAGVILGIGLALLLLRRPRPHQLIVTHTFSAPEPTQSKSNPPN